MKKVNIARNGYILISVVFYIAGLLHMIWRGAPPFLYCIVSGIILIAYGIIKVTGYLSDDLYCLAFQYDLGCGLFLIVVGILVLICSLRIWQYIYMGLGLLILLDSLLKIQLSRDAREFGLPSWNLILILAVIAGVFGVLIAIKPFQNENMRRIITGCGLLMEGALNHLVVKDTVYVTKRHAMPDKKGKRQKSKEDKVMDVSMTIKKFGLEQAFKYLYKDPEKNLLKLMDWADKFAGDEFVSQRRIVREAMTKPEHPYYAYIRHILADIDPHVMKTTAVNFFINAALEGWPRQEECRKKYGCNIPWTILLDPTSACNLHCTGCWAAEYGNKLNLTYDEIDDIICQGKELGVYMYIYTGGEPLVRKADLIRLCEKHSDCVFLCFTNATLIDEEFADEMLRVGNFVPSISLEGFEEATDGRRGDGVYQKVIKAMELLRRKKLFYGISACYTSANFESITSEAFFDSVIDMGAYFIWYFHYMPVGNDASPELMPDPVQRRETYRRIRKYRLEKPLFAMDFQNDAEYVGGCIAGGRRYFHINANGDIDPCVFIHYSDSNIREKTILEALQSPMMMAYHDGQPFNENMLRPCPMLENPEKLRKMVAGTDAHSTDLQSPETAEHLCAKCDRYAQNWKPVAEELWNIKKAETLRK